MNPTRTEAIKNFLNSQGHKDLAELYTYSMEVQINVAQDNGTRHEGEYAGKQWLAWTDGLNIWKSFRIPYKANTEPEYIDKPMSFDLAKYVEGIGMTGWDWVNKVSRWVAYDFDAILGHTDNHSKKLTDNELNTIKETVNLIPWITLRMSTSGRGLHLYVHLDKDNLPQTNNHHEHAALARAILSNLSGICGYDFNSKVDICGGNMWVWHRKIANSNGLGLKIIKSGEPLKDIPTNWKSHLSVIRGKSTKTKISNNDKDTLGDDFEELTGQRSRISLDPDHKKLIDFLQERKLVWWWDQDHWMLVTHTYSLKEAYKSLGFKGIFDTIATGSNYGNDINCYCYPLSRGVWAVRRYSPGCKELDTWDQDGTNWTKCFLNREIDFETACKINKGIEHPKGGYRFNDINNLIKCLSNLGVTLLVHPAVTARGGLINLHKQEGKVIITIPSEKSDLPETMEGWINERGHWKRVLSIKCPQKLEGETDIPYDDIVRHLITPNNEDCGWVIKSEGKWNQEPLSHIKAALDSMTYNNNEKLDIIGENIFKPWRLVNIPFQAEYPGDRTWNRDAAKLRFQPSLEADNPCPTWNSILEHCGGDLDNVILENTFCKVNGIVKGSEYLRCWIASLIKEPTQPLPYLFFFGDQDSGKSSFHEAIGLLFTRGYMRADTALTSQSGFNGELENIVLAVVEETDLKKNNTAYARIKDWVTSPNIAIHKKQRTPYMSINTVHFVQCANDRSACPVFPGDTRITMIYVPQINESNKIAKKDLIKLLEKEAPDFLAQILRLELPSTNDRLNLPVLTTESKTEAQSVNSSDLQIFIQEYCYPIPGQRIIFSEFYDRFLEWLPTGKVDEWNRRKVAMEIPSMFPRGKCTDNINAHIGNITFDVLATSGQPYRKEGIWIKKTYENHSNGTSKESGQGHVSPIHSDELATQQ